MKKRSKLTQRNKAKSSKGRILSMLLALCMALTMMPVSAFAIADDTYDIWVGGVQVTSSNKGGITGTGIKGTVTYDSDTNTLTLNGAKIEGAPIDGIDPLNSYGIYAIGDLNMVIEGISSVSGGDSSEPDSISTGIYVCRADTVPLLPTLNISGNGFLIAAGGEAKSSSTGISSEGNLTVKNVEIGATGATATNMSSGVLLSGDGNLTIESNGILTAMGGESRDSYGIHLESNNSQLMIQGGRLDAMGGTATRDSYGILALNDIIVNDGTVEAEGKDAGTKSCGIYGSEITVNGGTVTASGGTVKASDGTAAGMSYGIFAISEIFITGGIVETVSSEASESKAMEPVPFYDINDSYGEYQVRAGVSEEDATTYALSAGDIPYTSSRYIMIEPAVALIGAQYYYTLQDAVDAVQDGQTIDLLVDIDLEGPVVIENSNVNSFILSLNGQILNGGDHTAILHEGTGTLTINDDAPGKVISTKSEGTILLKGGSLKVWGGTVANTSSSSMGGVAIYNCGVGDVFVYGNGEVIVSGVEAHAIENAGGGNVTVFGNGAVSASGEKAWAIHNRGSGDVYITGGLVSAIGTESRGIFNNSNGEVNVSGGIVSASGTESCAIIKNSDGDVIVFGGTVSATGEESVGINVNMYLTNSTTISIPAGSPIIKGEGVAMNKAPDLTNYSRVIVTASENYSGTPTTTYNPDQINTYKYLTFASQSSSGGSGGGGKSKDNNSPVPGPTTGANEPTKAEIKVSGTVDSNGNVTANLTDKNVNDALNKALEDAKKNGNEANGISLVLNVTTAGSTATGTVTVNLPKTVQDMILAKKVDSVIVAVNNSDIQIGMDLETVQEINKQANSDVNISVTRREGSTLSGEAKDAIGSRPVFDLKVTYGSGNQVQNFGGGSVTVTIPYTLGANENAANICAVYVNANGQVHWLTDSVYDSVAKVLRFRTGHFSTYGVGYKQNSTVFTDIEGHWAKEDITCVVSRGLFSGTSDTTFSPNTSMTRGMFVTVLGRLANADVSSYKQSSFTDVKSEAYYMGYIEWASKTGIVNGTGKGKFAPDQAITREQMAVIMSNYAKAMDIKLPQAQGENTFGDSSTICDYAKDAVKQMQMAGILSGKSGNLFDPDGTATRAEVSAVLHRFIELADSGDIK